MAAAFRQLRFALALLPLFAAFCTADEMPIDPALLEQLKSVDAKAADTKDLTADFVQEKHSALLKKPLVSKGVVRAKGAVMLWQTNTPQQTVLRIDSTSLSLLYVDQKLLEIYPLDGKLAQLASNPLPRLNSLLEQFVIERISQDEKQLTLRLTPRTAKLKDNVNQVVVVIDTAQAFIVSFELTDPDGERTLTCFDHVRINTGLADRAIELVIPPGTKTVHPLDAAP